MEYIRLGIINQGICYIINKDIYISKGIFVRRKGDQIAFKNDEIAFIGVSLNDLPWDHIKEINIIYSSTEYTGVPNCSLVTVCYALI